MNVFSMQYFIMALYHDAYYVALKYQNIKN